ncbi:MAG: hypothetical protein QW701_06620 [Candidatus Nezhaarchaeales archaeon]
MSQERTSSLSRISKLIEELDAKIFEALEEARQAELAQTLRLLETVKSYVELLKRGLEVKAEDQS